MTLSKQDILRQDVHGDVGREQPVVEASATAVYCRARNYPRVRASRGAMLWSKRP